MRKILLLAGALSLYSYALSLSFFYMALSMDTAATLLHKAADLGELQIINDILKALSALANAPFAGGHLDRGIPYAMGATFALSISFIIQVTFFDEDEWEEMP